MALPQTLIVAINEATAEMKYFLSNARDADLARILAVAFRRWTVEHWFRLGKQEAGLLHFEGRDYTGLIRHLILALLVMGFVATHTERLRGGKPEDHCGASLPGAESALRRDLPSASGQARQAAHERGHPLSPAAKRDGDKVAQETAA